MQGAASVPGRTPGGRARCAIAHPQRWYVGSVAGRTAAGPQQRSFGIAKERAAAMQRASAKVSRRACPGAPPTNPIDLPCGRIREGEDEHECEGAEAGEGARGGSGGARERGAEAPRRSEALLLARGARREARGPARASRRTPRPQEGCVAISAAPRLQVWGGYVSLRRRRSPEAGGAYAGEIQRAVAFAKGARLRG